MTMRLSVIAAAAALCCAGPALAAGGEPTSRDEQADADPQKVVCQVQKVTGSRLHRKRVCLTREQWREQARLQRQDLHVAQRLNPGRGG